MGNEKVNASVPLSAAKNPELKIRQRLKNDRVKAIWDDKKHAVFVRICLDQMRAGNKPHKTLNKLGYMNLEREFYKQTGFYYFKDQLKNHWDSTRRDWQAWTALRSQAGVGWDEAKGTYSQTEDWWASFAKVRATGGAAIAMILSSPWMIAKVSSLPACRGSQVGTSSPTAPWTMPRSWTSYSGKALGGPMVLPSRRRRPMPPRPPPPGTHSPILLRRAMARLRSPTGTS